MTAIQQDNAFISYLINSSLLEEAISWISSNLNVEEVFDVSELEVWALDNGFTKPEEAP